MGSAGTVTADGRHATAAPAAGGPGGAHGPRRATGTRPADIGRAAEDAAAAWLTAHGAHILHRNYRRRAGELDLVALEGGALVIAEVRTRSSADYGGAAASVGRRKQRRLVRASHQLLQQHREYARLPVRFDVLVVAPPGGGSVRVTWIRHAFEAT